MTNPRNSRSGEVALKMAEQADQTGTGSDHQLSWPSVWGVAGQFGLALLAMVLLLLVGTMAYVLGTYPDIPDQPSLSLAVWTSLGFEVILGGLALRSIVLRNRGQRPSVRSFVTRCAGPDLRLALLLALIVVPIELGLAWLSSALGLELELSTFEVEALLHPLSLVTSFTLVPVAEELFFRGVLYGALLRWGDRVAVVATVLISALIHWPLPHVIGVLPGMVLLTWLRMRTGRLAPSMVAHALNNALVTGLTLLASSWP